MLLMASASRGDGSKDRTCGEEAHWRAASTMRAVASASSLAAASNLRCCSDGCFSASVCGHGILIETAFTVHCVLNGDFKPEFLEYILLYYCS